MNKNAVRYNFSQVNTLVKQQNFGIAQLNPYWMYSKPTVTKTLYWTINHFLLEIIADAGSFMARS